MTASTLPLRKPLFPVSMARVAAAVAARWHAWRARRRQRLVCEALRALDPQTRRDLGLDDAQIARDARSRVGVDHYW